MKRRCIRQCFIHLIWKKEVTWPPLPARYPKRGVVFQALFFKSDAARYHRLMGKILHRKEEGLKHCNRWPSTNAEPKGKQSSNHPVSTSYVGFGGESQPRCEFFGTVELVRLPTMKVHYPRDNAAGEGSSSFLASLAEKRGQLMTEIPRLVWAVCFEFKTRLKATLDHWGFSCSAFRGKVSWDRCNLPHADRTSHSSKVQHPLSYWQEFLVVCLPAKVLKYQSNKSWSSEDTAEYFLGIRDNANCITSTTPNQSS